MTRLRVAWFSTGRGPGSRALLQAAGAAIAQGLPVEIACVFCNRERGEDPHTDEFIRLVESLKLPLVTLSSAGFRRRHGGKLVRKGDPLPQWRLDFDDEVLRLLAPFGVEIGVLAGYMLIFGSRACAAMTLLNLHPAAPGGPIGIWQDVIWELIASRAERSGVTIFRAVPEVDTGPPLTYCTYALHDADSEPLWTEAATTSVEQLRSSTGEELPLFQEIRRRGAMREPPLILETLRALAEGRVNAQGGEPLDLMEMVDRQLATGA